MFGRKGRYPSQTILWKQMDVGARTPTPFNKKELLQPHPSLRHGVTIRKLCTSSLSTHTLPCAQVKHMEEKLALHPWEKHTRNEMKRST